MTVLQVLIDARMLIEKPENWCQNSFESGEARCIAGAYIHAAHELSDNNAECQRLCDGARTAIEDAAGTFVLTFNDAESRTHAEVLAVFDRAIEAERAKVQQ